MGTRDLDLLVAFSAPGAMRFGQRGHVLYLSGYEPYFGNSMLVLPADEGLEPLLQIDEANHFPSTCTRIPKIQEPQDPVRTIRTYLLDNRLRSPRIGIVGEYSIDPGLLDRIRTELRTSSIVCVSEILENARAVKSEYEIDCIKHACEIAKHGFRMAAERARPGVTDRDMVTEIEKACRETGSEEFPHRTMFSSGNDRSYLEWWWLCGNRKLKKVDSMIADFGTMYRGYCCDMARSFSLGPPSKEHRDAHDVIVQAEAAAQKAARPGRLASEVDAAAAEALAEFSDYVTTGGATDIGHGVGLEVHEWPFVGYHHIEKNSIYRDMVLKENMVISLEPQIYHPKFGLLQIEDQFRVTKNGGQILTTLPRELIEC